MCYLFISTAKRSLLTVSGRSSYFEFWFWFSSTILPSKMKSLFFSLLKFAKSSCHFVKHKSVFFQILHQSSVPSNITLLYMFSSNIICFIQKEPFKVQIFETFECSGQNSSNCGVNFETTSQFLLKFWIILYCHVT